jgi:hypothetical protein
MRFVVLAALFGAIAVAGANSAHAASAASVVLVWTTPGDDGTVGVPTAYDLRYSPLPINAANFSAAPKVSFIPKPSEAGTLQTCSVSGLTPGKAYYFALKTVDDRGNWSTISNIAYYDGHSVAVAGEDGGQVSFSSPFPNPAVSSTNIGFALPRRAGVRVDAYDTQGRRVRTLLEAEREPGQHEIKWDLTDTEGKRLCGGVYFLVAQTEGQIFKKRVVVAR